MPPARRSQELLPANPLLTKEKWHAVVPGLIEADNREHIETSILYADIMNFKGLNDELGQLEGDKFIDSLELIFNGLVQTLRTQSRRTVSSKSRHPDVVMDLSNIPDLGRTPSVAGRIGGDEFAVYAQTGEIGATRITERLSSVFEAELARSPHRELLEDLDLDIAIGHSVSTPEDTKTAKAMIQEANANSKANKENKVLERSTVDQFELIEELTPLLIERGLDWRRAYLLTRAMASHAIIEPEN